MPFSLFNKEQVTVLCSYLPSFETLYLQGLQTPFRNAFLTHVECLFLRFNFRKIGNYTPIFGLFLPPTNLETLINSHFQILRGGNFSQKRAIFEG